MKRNSIRVIVQCCLVCFLSIGVVWSASAQSMRVGIGVGGYFPVADATDAYDFTPGAHGAFLWRMSDEEATLAIEAEGGYWMLQDALNLDNYSASIIPLTGGLRYYPAPALHIDGGVGVYRYSFEYKEKLINVDGTENDFGMYGGAGFQSGPFDFKVRVHFPDASETGSAFIGITFSYLFLRLM